VVCLSVAIGLFLFLGFIPLFSMYSFSLPVEVPAAFAPSVSGMIALLEGKMIMILSFVAAACLIAALVISLTASGKVRDLAISIASAVGGGCGLTLGLWLLGFIWDIFAFSSAAKAKSPADVGLAPGIGLWIGLALALGVVAVFSTLSTLRGQSLWLYAGEGVGLLLGVLLLTVNVQPWVQGDPNKPDSKGTRRYKPLVVMPKLNVELPDFKR
jgi:hypothetical protein